MLRTGRILTLHPSQGRAGAPQCTRRDLYEIAVSGAPECTWIFEANMAVLEKTQSKDRDALRVFPVTAKFTRQERRTVTEFARSKGMARGQWMREVLLAELGSGNSEASLAEILGVRLLLVNVLRPLAAGQRITPEAFDKLLDDISTAKHDLAAKLVTETGR